MGREILLAPKLLVVAQPTWGVDVGAAAFIRQQLIDLRDEGTAILVISEELEELFEISDRIAVIAGGRLSPIRQLGDTNIDEIGIWMSGMWDEGRCAYPRRPYPRRPYPGGDRRSCLGSNAGPKPRARWPICRR